MIKTELMKWSDNLSVGIKTIDEQHKKLISAINQLNEFMMKGKGKEVIGPTLSELVRYTDYHFNTEEAYFSKYNYPDSQAHRSEHENFKLKVKAFVEKYNSSGVGLSSEIMIFLSDWIFKHIMGVDKKYSDFFKSKGLN